MYLDFRARGASTTPPNSYYEPPEPRVYYCPVCGEECHTLYTNGFGEIVACNDCLGSVDAADYFDEEDDDES